MTRKDYLLIAEAIRTSPPADRPGYREMLAEHFADKLERYVGFNRERFLAACAREGAA